MSTDLPDGPVSPDTYAVGYRPEVVDFFSSRRAAKQAAFFVPYLSSGITLLDCGCGPGSLTTDLAEVVVPGEAYGIDIEPSQILAARKHAASRGVRNVHFAVASVYELPYSDGHFDAAFIHGVLEHLRQPVEALREVRRVLKIGGVLGLRHADLGGHLLAPIDPRLERFFELYRMDSRRHGGDPDFGRHQLAALHRAGFARIAASASYDCWTETPDQAARMAEMMASHLTLSRLASEAVEQGVADRAELTESARALEAWGRDPAAFAAEAWCEAVARRVD